MNTAQQTAVEKALTDRDRQWRLYRAAKRRQYEDLFADEQHGGRLRKFRATLGHFGIEDADNMVGYVGREARWLRAAPDNIRQAALEMVDSRIQRIRARAGLAPFDDPLPGAKPNVFMRCKEALGL